MNGEVPVEPLPEHTTTTDVLVRLARLIRRLPDAAQGRAVPTAAVWGATDYRDAVVILIRCAGTSAVSAGAADIVPFGKDAEAGEPVADGGSRRTRTAPPRRVAVAATTKREPSGTSIRLRPYEAVDAAATWEVFHAAVRHTAVAHYSAAQVAAWAPDEVDADRWACRRARAWTLLAVNGKQVAGFADLTDAGELDMLFVHPQHAREGIATRLVAAVVTEARHRGLSRVEVRASRVLQPLLERLGFVLDEDYPANRIGDQVLANARLHLTLRT